MEKFIFEYIDVSSIDEELKCAVCYRPFHSPMSNPKCGHTFCQECVIKWYDNSSNCPTCRQNVTFQDFQPVTSRAVLNQLSRLNLKCSLCEETNISDREKHIQICSKQTIKCTSADIQCQWEGERQALPVHLQVCPFQHLRPIIDRLIQAIEVLKKTQDDQSGFIQALINEGHVLSDHCSAPHCLLNNSISRKNTISMPCSLCKKQIVSNQIALHSCTTLNCICGLCLANYTSRQSQSLQLNLKRELFSLEEDEDVQQSETNGRRRSRSRSPVRRRFSRSPSPF